MPCSSDATTFSDVNFSLIRFFSVSLLSRWHSNWHSNARNVLGAHKGRTQTGPLCIDLWEIYLENKRMWFTRDADDKWNETLIEKLKIKLFVHRGVELISLLVFDVNFGIKLNLFILRGLSPAHSLVIVRISTVCVAFRQVFVLRSQNHETPVDGSSAHLNRYTCTKALRHGHSNAQASTSRSTELNFVRCCAVEFCDGMCATRAAWSTRMCAHTR